MISSIELQVYVQQSHKPVWPARLYVYVQADQQYQAWKELGLTEKNQAGEVKSKLIPAQKGMICKDKCTARAPSNSPDTILICWTLVSQIFF